MRLNDKPSPLFDVIIIEEEFGVEKPDQRIFLHALDQLHISAHEAWMIGDDLDRDIAGSQQVGIFAIWCNVARQELLNTNTLRPDRVIYDLSEVLDMLISWERRRKMLGSEG
jgi:putative hydrolase of the HAD superfamily